MDTASALASAVTEEFGLVGVNGIDFVVRDGVPYAIEVNPRWCASMELVERAYGFSVFDAHASACTAGALPDFDLREPPGAGWKGPAAFGKAVVYARRDVAVGDTRAWLVERRHPGHPTSRRANPRRPAGLHGVRNGPRRERVPRSAGRLRRPGVRATRRMGARDRVS